MIYTIIDLIVDGESIPIHLITEDHQFVMSPEEFLVILLPLFLIMISFMRTLFQRIIKLNRILLIFQQKFMLSVNRLCENFAAIFSYLRNLDKKWKGTRNFS